METTAESECLFIISTRLTWRPLERSRGHILPADRAEPQCTDPERFNLQMAKDVFIPLWKRRTYGRGADGGRTAVGLEFNQRLVVTGMTLTVAGDERGDGAGRSFKHSGGFGVDQHGRHQLAVDGRPAEMTSVFTTSSLLIAR